MSASTSPDTLKLLTLLNVSATKPTKRSRPQALLPSNNASRTFKHRKIADDEQPASNLERLVGRAIEAERVASAAASVTQSATATTSNPQPLQAAADSDDEDDDHDDAATATAKLRDSSASSPRSNDAFDVHLASEGSTSHAGALESYLSSSAKPNQEGAVTFDWTSKASDAGPLGNVVRYDAKGLALPPSEAKLHSKAIEAMMDRRKGKQPSPLQHGIIDTVAGYQDLLFTRDDLDTKDEVREAIAAHLMSHLNKQRRRVLRNNERLAKAASSSTPSEVPDLRDQGFTRPSVLILLPLRNSALYWVQLLSELSGLDQIENVSRFTNEFSLPQGSVDKLSLPEAVDKYAPDHRSTFAGNIDDSFRVGLKLTRKSLKLYSSFYDSDVIVASPLGLRLLIEKDRDSDFLSSIDIVVADQLNVMMMQNWEHVQFIFSRLSHLPSTSHSTDFSRVKAWALSSRYANFRQSILLSPLDDPEPRALFSKFQNVAGRVRSVGNARPPFEDGSATKKGQKGEEDKGVMSFVREGIRQSFTRFECANLKKEADLRLNWFMTKTLPTLRKSALSASRTIIVVPSYFDFVRLEDEVRKLEGFSYTTISEYSSGGEISRARQAFFAGKKDFLIITERFHFYRRYVLRGARTIVFYAPPMHAHFYAEMLAMPFARGTHLHPLLAAASSSLPPAPKKNSKGKGKGKRGGEDDEEDEEEEEEVDPAEVNAYVVFSRYDLLRLQRIVGSSTAAKMVGNESAKSVWRFA